MGTIQITGDRCGDANAAVMLARLKGRTLSETPDSAEVDRFCGRLKNVTYRSYKSNRANPERTQLPRRYRNVRVTDARDGAPLGSIYWIGSAETVLSSGVGFRVVHDRPTAQNIISICLCLPFEEITHWHATKAVPSNDPGLLDLVVDIETRPRELLMVDGEPLPPGIVSFLTARAPAKARRTP